MKSLFTNKYTFTRVSLYRITFLLFFSLSSLGATDDGFMDPRFNDETKAFLYLLAQSSGSRGQSLEVEALRQHLRELHQQGNAKLHGTFKGTLEEQVVKTQATDVPISIYTPTQVDRTKLVIFFHGGGWVLGSRETHQTSVNILADATNTIWISVEYRLGPEHKYPVWLDDSSEVVQHIIENKASYGVEPTAKLGVSGDSAGGMIAASLARTLKSIDFQILIYPGLDLHRQTPSAQEFRHAMYVLSSELIDWFLQHAFPNDDYLKDPRACALLSTSLEGVPPCLFIVADLDPLRDGSFEYQKMLEKAGVKTKLVLIEGVVHGFFALPGSFPKASAQVTESVREFMASV